MQVLVVNFFCIFEIKLFCFIVAMSDLVYNVETIHGLCYTLNHVFCRIQSFVYLQCYLYCIGNIVNNQRIVCDRIHGSRYNCL